MAATLFSRAFMLLSFTVSKLAATSHGIQTVQLCTLATAPI